MTLGDNLSCNSFCTSCHYKDLDYFTQLQKKQSWTKSQLKKWEVLPILPAPENEHLGYRSKTWLRAFWENGVVSFGQLRSKKIEGKWEKEFINWDTCPLHTKEISEILVKLKKVLPSELNDILVGVWFGPPHLVFVLKKDSDFLKKIKWEEILTHPFKVAWSHVNSQVGRHIFGHLPIEPLTEILDSHPIRVFRQMGQTLLQEARFKAADWIKKSKVKMVLDLYCGTGDFSLLLPKEIEWLGIELSKDAAEYAKIIRPNNQAFAGKVEHRLGDLRLIDLIKSPYSLYLNPPRMGIQDVAKEKLKNLFILNAPEVIAYLSCSASSLSRGLEFFESQNYKVHMLQPYDFFPQTEHFETLALLKKN